MIPASLEGPRTEIAEHRMPSLGIVEELEILEERGARRRARGTHRVVDQLDLQRREKALGHGIVWAIAAAAHTADDPVVRQLPLVVATGVLTAPIRMVQQTPWRAAAGQRR